MSTENLNKLSDIVDIPKVNVDILKKRIIDQKKKERVRTTIIFSAALVSISALTYLAY